MRNFRVLIALLCVLALSACDSIRQDRIRVGPSLGGSVAVEWQDAEVVQALALVARQFAFSDDLSHARSEGVLAYYVEPSEDFPIVFGARRLDGELIVDIRHFAPGVRASARYSAIKAAITHELSTRLGAGSVKIIERQRHER